MFSNALRTNYTYRPHKHKSPNKPPGGYISFRSAWENLANREEMKTAMYESIRQRLSPTFEIIKTKGVEDEDRAVKL